MRGGLVLFNLDFGLDVFKRAVQTTHFGMGNYAKVGLSGGVAH